MSTNPWISGGVFMGSCYYTQQALQYSLLSMYIPMYVDQFHKFVSYTQIPACITEIYTYSLAWGIYGYIDVICIYTEASGKL